MRVRRVSAVASAFVCVLLTTGCATTHIHTSAPPRPATTTSTAPGTTTSTQAAAAPGLTAFDPFSFTALSLQMWWLLGSIPCDTAQRCPELLRTTDGGADFEQLAAPDFGWVPNGSMDSGLRFADASHGWLFGPGLWSTDDGGSTWVQQHVAGTVTDVEAADGEAYALVCTTGAASCSTMELLRTAVSGGGWSPVNLPAPLFGGSDLAVRGDEVFIMNGTGDQQGDQGSSLLVSTDGGRTFSVEQSECTPGLDGHVQPAIAGGGVLWESCPTGMEAQGKQSDDYGETWHAARDQRRVLERPLLCSGLGKHRAGLARPSVGRSVAHHGWRADSSHRLSRTGRLRLILGRLQRPVPRLSPRRNQHGPVRWSALGVERWRCNLGASSVHHRMSSCLEQPH